MPNAARAVATGANCDPSASAGSRKLSPCTISRGVAAQAVDCNITTFTMLTAVKVATRASETD